MGLRTHGQLMGICAALLGGGVGCMNRETAPICPVPIEINSSAVALSGFQGVDLVVVVDNSGSMEQEQKILATGFFTLINGLIHPVVSDATKGAQADDLRVAITTSDLGLQWSGRPGPAPSKETDGGKPGCSQRGKDGELRSYAAGKTVSIQDGVIACDESAVQCPTGWSCAVGKCRAPAGAVVDPDASGFFVVDCPPPPSIWAEWHEEADAASPLAFQAACMAQVVDPNNPGCGFEQQLESTLAGSNKQADFIREGYLLAVMVVSDEEDCSIQSKEIFASKTWHDTEVHNTACNWPVEQEQYLYPITRYREQLIALKGNEEAVVFAAIVGVPNGDSPSAKACQGQGNALGSCLDQPEMKLALQESEDYGVQFVPACTRVENGKQVTEATPGRRFVQVAENFGKNGFVYSICNPDWSPAMAQIASFIGSKLPATCPDKKLDWNPETKTAGCDVVVEFHRSQAGEPCPAAFGIENEVAVRRESIYNPQTGALDHEKVFCPLPKLPHALACAVDDTAKMNQFGWYYCEDDAADSPCQHKVALTEATTNKIRDAKQVAVVCLQQFSFEDKNCQENTAAVCNDGQDNDGNRVFDCANGPDHQADPNCCPISGVDAKTNLCQVDKALVVDVCGAKSLKDIDACTAAAEARSCDLP